MTLLLSIAIPLAVIYYLFLAWYGGNGKPLSPAEIEHFLAELNAHARSERDSAAVAEVRLLLANDDGKEFVMQNLVRHRPRAAYPPGYPPGYPPAYAYDDDARKADTRWGKAILWPLLRFGNHPVLWRSDAGNSSHLKEPMPGITSPWCVTAVAATFYALPWWFKKLA